MAALMMEILYRSGSQFHKIERPVTRVGRALDNDVILSDPTVSPYHFVIRKNETGTFELRAIADENGIRVGRRLIEDAILAARRRDYDRIVIQGDPNAEGFYLAIGAKRAGERESGSIPGRFLPVFEIDLHDGLPAVTSGPANERTKRCETR